MVFVFFTCVSLGSTDLAVRDSNRSSLFLSSTRITKRCLDLLLGERGLETLHDYRKKKKASLSLKTKTFYLPLYLISFGILDKRRGRRMSTNTIFSIEIRNCCYILSSR